MAKKIITRREGNISDELAGSELHPLLQRLYANRKITSCDDINYCADSLLHFESLKGLKKAVDCLADAIVKQKKLLIVGDYDADGATSTALATRALIMMGFKNVDYLVPNRFEFGYGLSPAIVEVAAQRSPDIIMTVDNGISSIEGVNAANDAAIKVIITDHHLPAESLPAAHAIVNPNQPGCRFEGKNSAGVGVVFYLMLALRAHLRELGKFNARDAPNLASLLDLVAVGTVSDVVPLDRNNRVLVEQGLRRIRSGTCSAGITSLLRVAGRVQETCVASELGFFVGPRLNAAGRLEDMSIGIECLLTDDPARADKIANELHDLNKKRRGIEKNIQDQAMQVLQPILDELGEKNIPAAICLYHPDWHQGVIGIVASRIKEKFHRPVIVFAKSGDDAIKGSARSISKIHIRDALESVAREPGLITMFGGHAMAAGLTLPLENFEKFNELFVSEVERQVTPADLQGAYETDGQLSDGDMELHVAELVRRAGPWGSQFPEPMFDGNFEIINWRVVGEAHLKLSVTSLESDTVFDAIAFNTMPNVFDDETSTMRLVYRLDVNEYRQRRSVQLIVEYMEPVKINAQSPAPVEL